MIELIDKLICPVKINITLRVLSQRPDGYHEIYSAFWRKKGIEGLTIYPNNDENIGDILEVTGIRIKGPNIVTKTLEWARANGAHVPHLHIKLDKEFPMGSGIGAGSGNAATLITWLNKNYNFSPDCSLISQLGADVSFLALGSDVAIAEGIGEKLTPLKNIDGLIWVLAFPRWISGTALAYYKLDKYREKHVIHTPDKGFAEETANILHRLRNKEYSGLLPNDFLDPLSDEHPEYEEAFKDAEDAGAIAWGLCGSGSALFAICKDLQTSDNLKSLYEQKDWIIKITKLE